MTLLKRFVAVLLILPGAYLVLIGSLYEPLRQSGLLRLGISLLGFFLAGLGLELWRRADPKNNSDPQTQQQDDA
jgi:hypothetical protein